MVDHTIPPAVLLEFRSLVGGASLRLLWPLPLLSGAELRHQAGVLVHTEGAVEASEEARLLPGNPNAVAMEVVVAAMALYHGRVPNRVLAEAVDWGHGCGCGCGFPLRETSRECFGLS